MDVVLLIYIGWFPTRIHPNGYICDNLPRLIIKGVDKSYYGVWKKPHSRLDIKRGKGPQDLE
jgi:hypothetical protein